MRGGFAGRLRQGASFLLPLIAVALQPPAALAQTPPSVVKSVGPCSPHGCPVYQAPGQTPIPYKVEITNNSDSFLVIRLVDDVPALALDFRVTNRGDGQPCGAPGGPVCTNLPAPGGANGSGRIVIDGIMVARAGSILATATITYEVDFSCPPLETGQSISNQASVFTTSNPAICNPCLSNPAGFSPWCLPPPEFTVTKTASVDRWSPGQDPRIGYRIEVTNASMTDPLPPDDLQVFDLLPTWGSGFPAFDVLATCPIDVTTVPPAPIRVDDHCDQSPDPFITVQRFADVPPLGSYALDLDLVIRDDLPDGFEFCNQAVVYYGITGSAAQVGTCTRVVVPQPVDLRDSVKAVTPSQVRPGTRLAYVLDLTNSGTSPATGVVLTDVIPDCLDDRSFDPSVQVWLDSGPLPGPAVYGPGRMLTVPIPDLAPGETQILYIAGLIALDPVCCNQAFLTANEIGAPGQPTGAASGRGDRTCYGPGAVDFRQTTKSVTPGPIEAGAPLAYTIDVKNAGAVPASNLVVTDILPGCIDDSAFDPLVDVVVTPRPAAAVSYQRLGRLLTVQIDRLGPLETATVAIGGLLAGRTDGACCNQAFVASDEVPPIGDPSGQTAGTGDPTCVDIVAAGCDLNRVVTGRGDRREPWLYTNGCSLPARLPGPALVLDVVTDAIVDVVSAGTPAGELSLYQLDCPCAERIHLWKDAAAAPAAVRIRF